MIADGRKPSTAGRRRRSFGRELGTHNVESCIGRPAATILEALEDRSGRYCTRCEYPLNGELIPWRQSTFYAISETEPGVHEPWMGAYAVTPHRGLPVKVLSQRLHHCGYTGGQNWWSPASTPGTRWELAVTRDESGADEIGGFQI